jgi:lincosamide nucleotidyltransferase
MKNQLPQHAMIARLTKICDLDIRVEAAMLYGSFATGEDDEYSDLDVRVYFDDVPLAELDQKNWLDQIEPIAFCYINEFDVTAVVFNNLVRGEFHFDLVSDMANLEEFLGNICFPSLENTILVDKTGKLSAHIEKLIGSPPGHTTPEEAQNLCNSFINWFLFGINVFARGEFSRADELLHMVDDILLRMIRLVEGVDEYWITPTKSLELEISPKMYRRFLACTSAADADSLAPAYQACLDLGRELMAEMMIQFKLELPEDLIERLIDRFFRQVSLKNY